MPPAIDRVIPSPMPSQSSLEQEQQQLFSDLLRLSDLSTEAVRTLADRLEQHEGFVSTSRAAEETFEQSDAAAVVRLLDNLNPDGLEVLLETLTRWRTNEDAEAEVMSDEQFERLRANLPALIRYYPAVFRTRKANALQTATGNELMGMMFVCDARPIYNRSRDDIEGYVPLATAKLQYQKQDTTVEQIEFVMTPEELDILILSAEQAKRKLSVLARSLANASPNIYVGEQA